jgi:gamma-glutamylcyclotransferase (GGCT)/AIG2-like uncharacterized protein YtfP
MGDLFFVYGTLMAGFDRRRRVGIDTKMSFVGRGWIEAALYDLGIFPAAVPAPNGRVWGEVYEADDTPAVLAALDQIEGYRPSEPDASLYTRVAVQVLFEDGTVDTAWVYFYNAPLGRAEQISSGDYLQHLRQK